MQKGKKEKLIKEDENGRVFEYNTVPGSSILQFIGYEYQNPSLLDSEEDWKPINQNTETKNNYVTIRKIIN